MRSDKQNEASRKNGARSKGPVTPEGKARSSQNAITHGMTSETIVLRTESTEVYDAFRKEILAELKPAGLREEMLVNNFIQARWRMIRILELEAATLDNEIETQRTSVDKEYETIDAQTRTALGFNALFTGSPSSVGAQYGRYESRLHRIMERSLKELDRLQALRLKPNRGAASQAAPGPQPCPNASERPQNDKTNPRTIELASRPVVPQTQVHEFPSANVRISKLFDSGCVLGTEARAAVSLPLPDNQAKERSSS